MHAKGMPTMADIEEIIDPECDYSSAERVQIGEVVAGTRHEHVLVQVSTA
jgi:hypothetical protein